MGGYAGGERGEEGGGAAGSGAEGGEREGACVVVGCQLGELVELGEGMGCRGVGSSEKGEKGDGRGMYRLSGRRCLGGRWSGRPGRMDD